MENSNEINDLKKRIVILTNMQIEALQTKIDILNQFKISTANANKKEELIKLYQDLSAMVMADNIPKTYPAVK